MLKQFQKDIQFYLWLLLGLILRVFNLNYDGLWNDELFTARTANPNNTLSYIVETLIKDVHPPLHNFLTQFWAINFGYNDFSLRMFSVVVGVLGLYTLYQLAKLLFNKKVALLALFIAAINPFLIEYSQEVRSYAFLFLLANGSYLFFIKFLKAPQKNKDLIFYILFTTAALYTHYFAVYLIASQGFVAIAVLGYKVILENWKRFFILFMAPILLFIPWLPILIKHLEQPFVWIKKPKVEMLFSFPGKFFNDVVIGAIAVTLIIFFVIYLFFRKNNIFKKLDFIFFNHRRPLLILTLWYLGYFTLPFIKSLFSSSNMMERYFIVIICPLIIFLAFIITKLSKKIKKVVLSFFIILSGLNLALKATPYFDKKSEYRETISNLKGTQNNTPLLFIGGKWYAYSYYLNVENYNNVHYKLETLLDALKKEKPKEFYVIFDYSLYQTDKNLDSMINQYYNLNIEGYKINKVKDQLNSNKSIASKTINFKRIN